ncbi:MAG: class I tRNA ligase family protein, partial [Eggerthellaceae bacterium]|nr:class I tRNA ligase family protein [Eggerthellaceae bacterium]
MSPQFNNVTWPKRAVVTAGMPYGNKALHFGHVGGVFVPADCFARFLRDRIGAENVRFVSGTDCFGSPIAEGYRKKVESGEFEGSISDYVMHNHQMQAATLKSYGISLSVFEGSGIGHSGEIHQKVSDDVIRCLYEHGVLHRRETLQFYDAEADTFLNGRQVIGRCPVQGCKSEH